MKTTPIRAIRTKCSECAGSPRAATRCEKEDCPLHRYRSGHNPAREGIGRTNLHKDAHSGKFRPSQDGRIVSISRSSEGTPPGFNLGHPRAFGVQVDRPRTSAEFVGEMMLRSLSGGKR